MSNNLINSDYCLKLLSNRTLQGYTRRHYLLSQPKKIPGTLANSCFLLLCVLVRLLIKDMMQPSVFVCTGLLKSARCVGATVSRADSNTNTCLRTDSGTHDSELHCCPTFWLLSSIYCRRPSRLSFHTLSNNGILVFWSASSNPVWTVCRAAAVYFFCFLFVDAVAQ